MGLKLEEKRIKSNNNNKSEGKTLKNLMKKIAILLSGAAVITTFLMIHEPQKNVEAKSLSYLEQLKDSKVIHGEVTWLDEKKENFIVKANGHKYHLNTGELDGMLFNTEQEMWIEFNKKGQLKQVDDYNPITHLKTKNLKTITEKFKVTSNHSGEIYGDIIWSQTYEMGGEGIYLDKTYKHWNEVKNVKKGQILTITWSKKDYDNERWDNISSVKIQK